MQLINSSTAYWERRNNMIKTNNKQMTNNYTKVFVNRDSTCWYMKLDHSIRKAFFTFIHDQPQVCISTIGATKQSRDNV